MDQAENPLLAVPKGTAVEEVPVENDWTKDWLAFQEINSEGSDIWLLNVVINWFDELQRLVPSGMF